MGGGKEVGKGSGTGKGEAGEGEVGEGEAGEGEAGEGEAGGGETGNERSGDEDDGSRSSRKADSFEGARPLCDGYDDRVEDHEASSRVAATVAKTTPPNLASPAQGSARQLIGAPPSASRSAFSWSRSA